MSVDEHDKDIRSYGPCVRLYHWHGGGDGHSAHQLGNCILRDRKLLIRTAGRREKAFAIGECSSAACACMTAYRPTEDSPT
jgi:hypothetical protein